MKNSIRLITPQFNTGRMVGEYTNRFYCPAAVRYHRLNAEALAGAKEVSKWKARIKKAWAGFAIKDVKIEASNGQGCTELNQAAPRLKVGSQLQVSARVKLGNVNPKDVSVELYHGPIDSWGNIQNGSAVRMAHKEGAESNGDHLFIGTMSCQSTGQHGLTVRILPRHEQLVDPYEPGLILWENCEY
jgi:starch phosphorylase